MLQKQIHLFLLLRRRADAKGVQIWPKSKDFIEFFFDFFNGESLANPHKIRYLSKGHLIGALFEHEENEKRYIRGRGLLWKTLKTWITKNFLLCAASGQMMMQSVFWIALSRRIHRIV